MNRCFCCTRTAPRGCRSCLGDRITRGWQQQFFVVEEGGHKGRGACQKNREVDIRRNVFVLAFRWKFCKFPQGCSLDEWMTIELFFVQVIQLDTGINLIYRYRLHKKEAMHDGRFHVVNQANLQLSFNTKSIYVSHIIYHNQWSSTTHWNNCWDHKRSPYWRWLGQIYIIYLFLSIFAINGWFWLCQYQQIHIIFNA